MGLNAVILASSAVLSAGWCWVLRTTALSHYFADIPNDRSSHETLTPKSAGLVFTLCFIMGLAAQDAIELDKSLWVIVCCAGVGLLGFVDDIVGLSSGRRLIVQFLLTSIFVFIINADVTGSSVGLNLLFVLFILASINFYNFADGINGYIGFSSVLTITGLFVGAVISHDFLGVFRLIGLGLAALLVSLLVFIYFNLQARIFMGDSGSTFLGFFHGIVAVMIYGSLQNSSIVSSSNWINGGYAILVVLIAGFWVYLDCSAMILAKLRWRIPLSKPHREHLYQRLSRETFRSHIVTAGVLSGSQFMMACLFVISSDNWLVPTVVLSALLLLGGGIVLSIYHIQNIRLAGLIDG